MILEQLTKDILTDEAKHLSKPETKTLDLLRLKMYHKSHEELKDNFHGF